MIVSGWTLHVYCAYDKCGRFEEYGGRNERDARKQARDDGWVFRGGEVYCKRHTKRTGSTVTARRE